MERTGRAVARFCPWKPGNAFVRASGHIYGKVRPLNTWVIHLSVRAVISMVVLAHNAFISHYINMSAREIIAQNVETNNEMQIPCY